MALTAAEPLAAAAVDRSRWLCGVAASYDVWPRDKYEFRLPPCAIPLYADHEPRRHASSGAVPGDIGAARRFAEIPDLGVVTLIEVSADRPGILWDVAEGRRDGLSVSAHVDPQPGGGPAGVYFSEVSLTGAPADPLARVVSAGELALRDWELLTGETVGLPR